MYWVLGIVSFLVFLFGLCLWAERRGRALAQTEEMQGVLDDIHTVSLARDHLRYDVGYAERVRKRFTRKFL